MLFGLAIGVAPCAWAGGSLPGHAKTPLSGGVTNPAIAVVVGNRANAGLVPKDGPVLVMPGPARIRPIPGARIGRPAFPPAALRPGVYMSLPYTCLVVVPPSHLDDKFIIGGTGNAAKIDSMPMVKPPLHFIPLKAFPLRAPVILKKPECPIPAPSSKKQVPRSK